MCGEQSVCETSIQMAETVHLHRWTYRHGSHWLLHWPELVASGGYVGRFDDAYSLLLDEVGANRIESRHDPGNPHSGMVMKKCGMKYEGTLRSSDRNNQGICDADWYGLL